MQLRIKSFKDLDVYQLAYSLRIKVMTKIIPKLPEGDKYDLRDQLSRSCKAVPRLIAERSAKKHQKLGFQKYLDDERGESNETLVSIEQVKDIYKIAVDLCEQLLETYDKISRQLFNLSQTLHQFNSNRPPHYGAQNTNADRLTHLLKQ